MGSEGVIQAIAERMTKMLRATRCTIRVPRDEILWLMASHGADIESRPKKVKINEETIAGQAFITGKIVHVKDIVQDSRYDPSYIESGGPKEVVAIPIFFDGDRYGVMQIYRKKPFSKRQIAFADILAQTAGPTLYHIETTKTNRRALLDIVDSIFECTSTNEIFRHAVKKISERIEVPRCLIYQISSIWCEIVAGEPTGAHNIGLREPLREHPDIEFAVNKKNIFVIDQPLTDSRTPHFRRIIEQENIRAILYAPLILKKGDDNGEKNVIGVLVLDACNEKESFSAEEKSFCADTGIIIAKLIEHERKMLNEIADSLLNPSLGMHNLVQRLAEPLNSIYQLAEQCRAGDYCPRALPLFETAAQLLPRMTSIITQAKNTDSRVKTKQSQL